MNGTYFGIALRNKNRADDANLIVLSLADLAHQHLAE
jgi:hypothetical protein